MMILSRVAQIMSIIGTVAFALSGTLTAIDRQLDLFGVVFIGCITATGGGVLRDLLIGHIPPQLFSDPLTLGLAVGTSLFTFFVVYRFRELYHNTRPKAEIINNIFDAIGLSAFSVAGVEITRAAGFDRLWILCLLMGMITGVGGGILRDMMTESTPYIFRKHIYALASLTGSALYYVLLQWLRSMSWASAIAMLTVFAIRILATLYHWELPKIRPDK